MFGWDRSGSRLGFTFEFVPVCMCNDIFQRYLSSNCTVVDMGLTWSPHHSSFSLNFTNSCCRSIITEGAGVRCSSTFACYKVNTSAAQTSCRAHPASCPSTENLAANTFITGAKRKMCKMQKEPAAQCRHADSQTPTPRLEQMLFMFYCCCLLSERAHTLTFVPPPTSEYETSLYDTLRRQLSSGGRLSLTSGADCVSRRVCFIF